MRSVFVFPLLTRHQAYDVLVDLGVRPDLDPMASEVGDTTTLWAVFWAPLLPPDWDEATLNRATELCGSRPKWAIEITVSGTVEDSKQVAGAVTALLAAGGCVTNYSGELLDAATVRKKVGLGAWP